MRRFLLGISVLLMVLLPVHAQDELDTDDLSLLLEDFVFEDEPAVVLFVSIGTQSWVGARGLADIENDIAVQTDDLFRIGSVTKPLVATIMLQLVEAGEIDLDNPIANYLPDEVVVNVENADNATVRQMLQMTSGIFDYTESDVFNDATDANPNRAWTAAQTIETIYGEASYFAPGEDYYYSNSNYNLAQMIIESVTGISLAANLETRIFQPLGMTSCYLETPDRFAQGIARGYALDDEDNLVDVTDYNDGVGMGDGGIVCNAEDLAKFLPGLRDTLLSEAMLEEMLDTVADGEGGAYGLGMGYEEGEFGMQVGHDGSTSGFQSNMVYLPDDDVLVVVLTNNFDSDLVEELTIEAQAIAVGDY